MMITAKTVLNGAQRLLADSHVPVVVLWLQVDSRRSELKDQLVAENSGEAIVPIVLRGDGFQNVNGLLADLMLALENERASFGFLTGTSPKKLAIILLSLQPLTVPQISSPARLPDWFPVAGGEVVEILIRDFSRTPSTALNAQECRVPDIAARIHRLEGVLLERLDSLALKNPSNNWAAAFFEQIKDANKKGETYRDFLKSALEYNRGIVNPEGFRPSARTAVSLVARLMRLVSGASPDELSRRAKSLSEALGLTPTIKVPDSLVNVLLRPTNPVDETGKIGRNILVTIYAASQFVTAAAHADEYPTYSLPLLQGLSFDIRYALENLTQALE